MSLSTETLSPTLILCIYLSSFAVDIRVERLFLKTFISICMTYYTLQCLCCNKLFERESRNVASARKHGTRDSFCSYRCHNIHQSKQISVPCGWCQKPILTKAFRLASSKSGHVFCNHHCAASYANTHKTTGNRRSKLEIWLEASLQELFPDQVIMFNNKEAINSELDIYFPELKLAFELNGIFHYEPIYGPDKLAQVQGNDHRKFQACAERGISLCVIDTSSQKYVKPSTSGKFLSIIKQLVDSKLAENKPFCGRQEI